MDNRTLLAETDADPPAGTPEWDKLWNAAAEQFDALRPVLDSNASPLSTDDNVHSALMDVAAQPFGKQYVTEGLIRTPGQTFGVEIEFQGRHSGQIAAELHQLGLTRDAGVHGYHSGQRGGRFWTFETDGSVTGGEIISPVLQDTEECWLQLAKVCEVIRKHDGYVDFHAGGHIHVGVKSTGFDNSLNGLRKLVKLYGWSEDLLFRVGAAPETYPFHRGMSNHYGYCPPLGRYQALMEHAQTLSELRQYGRPALSLYSVGDRQSGTVEFRLFDGTLDPEHIQSNVMLACAMMRAAGRLTPSDIPDSRAPLGTFDADPQAGEKLLRRFADLVLETPEQRLKLYSSYARSAWAASPAMGPQRIREKRQQAVSDEVSRISSAMKEAGTRLSPQDKQWLTQAVDYNQNLEAEPPSERSASAYLWWLSRPLPRTTVDRAQWGAKRIAEAADFVTAEARDAVIDQCMSDAEASGKPLSPIEVHWLKCMLTNEKKQFHLLAPTAHVESCFQQIMADAAAATDPAAAFDIRLVPRVRKRWARYDQLDSFAAERDRLATRVQEDLQRDLSPEEHDAIARIARYDRELNLDAISVRSVAFVNALESRADQSHHREVKERAQAVASTVSTVRMREAIDTEVSAMGGDLTATDRGWLTTLLSDGVENGWNPPSPAAEQAILTWADQPMPAAADEQPDWKASLAATKKRVHHYQSVKAAVASQAEHAASESGWTPSDADREWMHTVVTTGRIEALPSLQAGIVINDLLAPVQPPSPNTDTDAWRRLRAHWRNHRLAVLRDFYRDAAVAQMQNGTGDELAWTESMLGTSQVEPDSYEPSAANEQVFRNLYADPGESIVGFDDATTETLRSAISERWAHWNPRSIARERRNALAASITGDSPEQVAAWCPEKVASWCRRMTLPCSNVTADVREGMPPSPEALIATAQWMTVPAHGDAEAVASFEQTRAKRWELAVAAVKSKNLWLHPRWRSALGRATAITAAAQTQATGAEQIAI